MARAPRAKVSASSGQGISRLAYQKAYAMKGGLTSKFSAGSAPPRDYGKKTAKSKVGGINVSYGDTIEPGDLADVKALGEGAPPKSWKDTRIPGKLKAP